MQKQKMCEDCGLKQPSYGLPSDGKKRWCAGCGKGHKGAQYMQKQKMCEDCGLNQPSYGQPSKCTKCTKRWCAVCSKQHAGAYLLNKRKLCEAGNK